MTNSVTIKNFDLAKFTTLLSQAISVTPQLMLEVDKGIIKSASFSHTKSLIKLFAIPIDDLIAVEQDEEGNPVSKEKQNFDGILFDFYILKGDSFRNYLSVFGDEPVDITFELIDVGNVKQQASSLKIVGKSSVSGAKLNTEFQLTTEELISNQISDYSEVLRHATPTPEMSPFRLSFQNTAETRGLIKKLHKSYDNNTSFLTFTFDKQNINIKDKAFELNFPNTNPENFKEDSPITFNILKNDFVLIGDHTFDIYTSSNESKVIYTAKFNNAIIWVMTTKVNSNYVAEDTDDDDFGIENIDVSEYDFND